MGNEGACATVHQLIAYKSGSVHMEPVPVVPWAPADILRKLHARGVKTHSGLPSKRIRFPRGGGQFSDLRGDNI